MLFLHCQIPFIIKKLNFFSQIKNKKMVKTDNSDMDQLERTILDQLNYYNSLETNSQTNQQNNFLIHKVPNFINEPNSTAYTPLILSIGPYHWRSPVLSQMNKPKWHCLRYILKLNHKRTLEDYLIAISSIEKEARGLYREDVCMQKHEFIQMLLLDGCFILASLYGTTDALNSSLKENGVKQEKVVTNRGNFKAKQIGEDSEINHALENILHELEKTELNRSKYQIDFNLNGMYNQVFHDLVLLENQIPFFVVEKIYQVLEGKEGNDFLVNIFDFLENDFLVDFPIGISESERPRDFCHLLHLCHIYFKPTKTSYQPLKIQDKNNFWRFKKVLEVTIPSVDQQPMRWRRAVEYYESGIEFRVKKSGKENPASLLDVTFRDGVFEIPSFSITETTEPLFRNLLALEQTCSESGNCFTAYIIMMSQLVSTHEDCALFVHNNIITHMLESDEAVSNMLTNLSRNIIFDFKSDYYLRRMSGEMEAYCQSRKHRWMAWVWQKKFKNPWLGAVKMGTVITVIATVVTTVCTVLVFLKPLEVQLVSLDRLIN